MKKRKKNTVAPPCAFCVCVCVCVCFACRYARVDPTRARVLRARLGAGSVVAHALAVQVRANAAVGPRARARAHGLDVQARARLLHEHRPPRAPLRRHDARCACLLPGGRDEGPPASRAVFCKSTIRGGKASHTGIVRHKGCSCARPSLLFPYLIGRNVFGPQVRFPPSSIPGHEAGP